MLEVSEEFVAICRSIVDRGLTADEWAEVESGDELQTQHFAGGFEALEMAFCFSHYGEDRETWFQVDLAQVQAVIDGRLTTLNDRPPG